MTSPETVNQPKDSLILSAEEWLNKEFTGESDPLIGSSSNPIVRPFTKNFIQAPEKAFKTTFLLRLMLGLSVGETIFLSLPIPRPHRVLYLHGELNPSELKQRLREAASGLERPLDNLFQGRSLTANLVTSEGMGTIARIVGEYRPEVFVIDPWQSFIAGSDENGFKDTSGATKFLDKLISDFGLTVFIAIHLGKNPERGPRGHSNLGGWRDTKFELKRKENKVTVDIEPRWAEPPKPMELTFRDGTLWEGDAPEWTKQEERIRALLVANNGQLTRDQVQFGLGLEDSALRMALKRAHEHHAIELDTETVRLPVTP